MRTALAVIFLSVMLTGSIFQTYEQSVKTDGSSTIKKEFDLGLFSGMLGENAEARIAEACSSDASLGCISSNGMVTISEEFSADGGYYSFRSDYGIPYIEYDLTINRIPLEKFSERLDRILLSAGLINSTSGAYGGPLNLRDAETNREAAYVLKQSGMDVRYVVVMPSGIASAAAGESSGVINGSRAEFLLSDVLRESQPIMVTSRELNLGYIAVIAAIVVLGAFALSFRKSGKGR
ncbi:hypothetical protein H0O02_04690 [Candidatus Micrarchaeota archaeon]|nr:hypothetical protein [Candidatus Micrarchaeota archaeon]